MGSLNPLQMISQIALAAITGGASMLVQAAISAVVSAVGKEIIQQLGQALGLPQGIIDMAQSAFSAAMGDASGAQAGGLNGALGNFGKVAGTSPFIQGQLENMVKSEVQKAVAGLATPANKAAAKETANPTVDKAILDTITKGNLDKANGKDGTSPEEIAAIMNGKGSILMKLAIVLGKLADKKMNEMADTAKQLGQFGEVDGKNSGQYQELTGKMQALGQETNIISTAMTNVLKTLGEAATTIARKG